jgi:hypothetical protein
MGKLKMAEVDLKTVSSAEALELVQWPCRDCGEVGKNCECKDLLDLGYDDEDLEDVYGLG